MVNVALLVEWDLKRVLENASLCRVGVEVSLRRMAAVVVSLFRVEDANVQHALVTTYRHKNVKFNHVQVPFCTSTHFLHIIFSLHTLISHSDSILYILRGQILQFERHYILL